MHILHRLLSSMCVYHVVAVCECCALLAVCNCRVWLRCVIAGEHVLGIAAVLFWTEWQ